MVPMITVSIVSHGHGAMLPSLIDQLLACSQIDQVIITLNISEQVPIAERARVKVIKNNSLKGFGSNHNQAFQLCNSEFFCVLNPDISFQSNPFSALLEAAFSEKVGLLAPLIQNPSGSVEDSVRRFPTPLSILCRRFFGYQDAYTFTASSPNFCPEWVGGMFMLFKSPIFAQLGGFDERYYLYVEDVDICARLWQLGYQVLVCPSVSVIHDARRASRRSWQHLSWHIQGLIRFFVKYGGRLPRVLS